MLLKASPQKLYGHQTESVDKYGVSISTGAPGPCFRFWSFFGVDATEIVTESRIVQWQYNIYIAESEIKRPGQMPFFHLDKIY
jgi:hypothetical protein